MSEIDKMARELLAAELHNRGRHGAANKVMQGRPAMFIEELSAIRTAMLSAPPGWKLVPVEPTPEMWSEAAQLGVPYPSHSDYYRALVAAAPEPK